jgi:release factor glutamine methyltransferase
LERVVVDLCCGSGAIGVAIAAAAERAGRRVQLNAADLDPAAVACARRNVEPIGGRVFEGDLLAALPDSLRGTVDVLAVNAPYVPTASIALMPPEAREHEHRIALDGGSDGLSVHRRVCAAATDWLAPGGRLLIEASEDQAPRTAELMAAAGLRASIVQDDDVDGTVVIGIRP